MPGTGNAGPVFCFGSFELDSRTGELRKHGVRISLQDQPCRVLKLLLENAGDLVSREQLQRQLWPDHTFVDFDNAINSAVRKLRDALGDTAENPRFVETLARRGYRFVGSVHTGPGTQAAPAPPAPIRWPWILGLSGLLAAVALALLLSRVWRRDSTVAELRVTPLTSSPGNETNPSFSPDGTRVAFSWDGLDWHNKDIYVKLVGPGDPVRLTKDPAYDFSPAWSPDGRWIAFLREVGGDFAVALTPASGGPERELTRANLRQSELGALGRINWSVHPSGEHILRLWYLPQLAWSPDGTFLFTIGKTRPDAGLAIRRISVETGEKQFVTSPPSGVLGDASPAVSPDGRALAFLRVAGGETRDIYVLSLSVEAAPIGEPRRVTFDGVSAGTPAWTPDGRELIFSSNRSGQRQLWRIAAFRSATPVRLAVAGENPYDVALSPHGGRLVYRRDSYSANLWRYPLGDPHGGEPVRVTATFKRDVYPDYSPDGKRVAFGSDRSEVNEIWKCDLDGSNAVQVTAFGKGFSGSPRWSPDGQTIAFDSNITGNWDVYVVRADGGRPARLTNDPAADFRPVWSRDGQWIYFTSNRSGRDEIWKMRSTGGSEKQLTTGGGYQKAESADGRYLYYIDAGDVAGDGRLWRMPAEGGASKKIVEPAWYLIGVTPRGVYYFAGKELRRLSPRGDSEPVPGAPVLQGAAALSPDGRWLLMMRREHSGMNLMLVENFR